MSLLTRNNITAPAPEFVSEAYWINSAPLGLEQLKGRVVMVNFWSYSCMNCIRELQFLKEWWDRYKDAGLMIIDIHTPEFEFEKDPENVESFCRKYGITWPVILDNDNKMWNAYRNRVWPSRYVIDGQGIIREHHFGRGGYADTEAAIRHLLKELPSVAELPPIVFDGKLRKRRICFPSSPKVHCGCSHGRIANALEYKPGKPINLGTCGILKENHVYLRGAWNCDGEYVQHGRSTEALEDSLSIVFYGIEAGAVLESADKTEIRVYITLNGNPVNKDQAGEDIRYNGGSSCITVREPRFYSIMRSEEFGTHTLRMAVDSDKLRVYAFMFGGCL